MIGKILPLLLAMIGTGAGVGAGIFLKAEPSEMAMHVAENVTTAKIEEPKEETKEKNSYPEEDELGANEYVKLNNQFLVPVVVDELVESLVVMTLSVEVLAGQGEVIYSREPKLRDAFLQVLFDHANVGGFQGEFTNAKNMDALRQALTEIAQKIAGDNVTSVLITDIARQDV